jgi:hypothetical protein
VNGGRPERATGVVNRIGDVGGGQGADNNNWWSGQAQESDVWNPQPSQSSTPLVVATGVTQYQPVPAEPVLGASYRPVWIREVRFGNRVACSAAEWEEWRCGGRIGSLVECGIGAYRPALTPDEESEGGFPTEQ